MQLYNSFAVLVSGTSLSIVIKYTRLKPRLIKNIFSLKRLILIKFLGHETALVMTMSVAPLLTYVQHWSYMVGSVSKFIVCSTVDWN